MIDQHAANTLLMAAEKMTGTTMAMARTVTMCRPGLYSDAAMANADSIITECERALRDAVAKARETST